MATIYRGWRTDDGCHVIAREGDFNHYKLPLRLDLFNHSPTGFEWGYGGSGPAQLALALLAHALQDDDRAVRLHQPFKFKVIGALPRNIEWQLTRDDIIRVASEIEAENAVRTE